MALADLEINTLAFIYTAMAEVDNYVTDTKLSKKTRSTLAKVYRAFDKARELIINKQVEQYIGQLEKASVTLQAAAVEIEKAIKRIKKLAKAIDDAAKAVAFIVNVAKGAGGLGLL